MKGTTTSPIKKHRSAGMEPFFEKEVHEARFQDPTDAFREKIIRIEVRTDLFSGSRARILTHRWRLPEPSTDSPSIPRSEKWCPFCPEKIDTATPRFPPSVAPEGRIRCGEAVAVPNAFPYSRYNAVCILSRAHRLSLDRFAPEILFDAIQACLAYVERIRKTDPKVAHASINWNYMPPAGAGMIHPHFQIVVDGRATRLHRRLVSASSEYYVTHGRNYWADLLSFEEKEEKRLISRCGKIAFISSYCPTGMLGEVLALFDGTGTLDEVGEEGWRSFSMGLSGILSCFHRMGYESLNMTLLAGMQRGGHFWTQARIIPRINVPPLGVSDVNYFEKGHGEVIVVISPEEFCERIRSLL